MNKQACIFIGMITTLFLLGCQDDSGSKQTTLTGKISQANMKAIIAEVLNGKISNMDDTHSTPNTNTPVAAKAFSRNLYGQPVGTTQCANGGSKTIAENGKITTAVFDQCAEYQYLVNGSYVETIHSGSDSVNCSLGESSHTYDLEFKDYYYEFKHNGVVYKGLGQGTLSVNLAANDTNSDLYCDHYFQKIFTPKYYFTTNDKTTEITDYSGQYLYSLLTGQVEVDYSGFLSSVAAGGTLQIKSLQTLKVNLYAVPLSKFYSEGIVEVSGAEGRILITIQNGLADDPQAVKVEHAGQTTYYSWTELKAEFDMLF